MLLTCEGKEIQNTMNIIRHIHAVNGSFMFRGHLRVLEIEDWQQKISFACEIPKTEWRKAAIGEVYNMAPPHLYKE